RQPDRSAVSRARAAAGTCGRFHLRDEMVAGVQRGRFLDRVRSDPAGGADRLRIRAERGPHPLQLLRECRCGGGGRMKETRAMPVPDGLDGMRVDAGLSRLLGLSRTAVAALTEEGAVQLDGSPAGKSDRLAGGSWLEVEFPEPK